jgi:hypothetical protein
MKEPAEDDLGPDPEPNPEPDPEPQSKAETDPEAKERDATIRAALSTLAIPFNTPEPRVWLIHWLTKF